jgi:membrane fusion protein, multidrug efflux system
MSSSPSAAPAAFVLAVLSAVSGCSKPETPPPPPVPVMVATAERRAVPFELAATGTVEPIQTVAVQPQVSGPVMRIAFREGQEVTKGQVLFQLDPRPFQAALAQAEGLLQRDQAQAANAEQDAKRYSALAEKEYVTAQQYDAARTSAAASTATLAASRAAVEQARLNLQYATIRAPISGRTGSLRVREGNLVRTTDATPLVTINQIKPILVRFAVPATNLPAIQRYRGDRIVVTAAPTGGGTTSEGALSFVDNAVDTTTGTILLKGTFPNADGALWPGEFVNVRLRLYVQPDALVVPASAVVSGQQGSFVFVIQADSSAATKPVKVDRATDQFAVVTGEVRPGDRVVTDGQLRLRDGSKVQIKAAGDSARARAS